MPKKLDSKNLATQVNPNVTNEELLSKLHSEGEIEDKLLNKIALETNDRGEVTKWADGKQIADVFATFPTLANSFIDTLVNRCVLTMFFNNRWKNKLGVFQKGTLSAGDSIQQIFVNLGERKGFGQNFESSGSPENNLIGKRVPKVDVDYISVNGRYKYKVSVSLEQLQQAFLDKTGLSSLANELIASNYETAEVDNYEDMYKMLFSKTAITDATQGIAYEKGIAYQMLDASKAGQPKMVIKCGTDPKSLIQKVRATAGNMGFKTTNYNLAKVRNHTDKSKLVFITTPDIAANIDVNVLAAAFNVSMAEITVRTVEVHELPIKEADGFSGNVLGMLLDEDLVQYWYKLNTAEQFRNADTLTTNHFLHQWVVNAACKFCNAVIFTDEALS